MSTKLTDDQKESEDNGTDNNTLKTQNDDPGITNESEHKSTQETQVSDIYTPPCDFKCTHEKYIEYRDTAKMMMYLIGKQLKYPV